MKVGTTVGPHIGIVEGDTDPFEFVEPALNPRDCPVDELDAERRREQMDAAGLDCMVHLPHFPHLATTITEVDEGIRAYQERALDVAETLGATKAVVHGKSKVANDQYREAFVEQAGWLADEAAERGVELVVENMGYSGGFPLDELPDVVREVGASVCFDVGHAFREGGQDAVESFLAEHGDLVSHLHVHDARSRGDDHIPIGTGQIDFAPVMAWASGRDVTVAVELLVDDFAFHRESVRRLRSMTPE
ncbi:sugar phosphate isomerase/epimerase family protein [Halobacterium wangiae]|uniref:sugar phosphate isomerase/epimerase family protein n=1 Tax=Halobacterium wangiae TaxID=2902623 RepID=UPI001E5760A9|nr:sugar phosphate isomerase/epimerase family protein [Halobacterium wangiae]